MRYVSKVVLIVIFTCVTVYLKVTNRSRCNSCSEDILFRDVDDLKGKDLLCYIYVSNSRSCRIVHDFGGIWIRVLDGLGSLMPYQGLDGQKSVCMEPDFVPKVNNCVVYSVGISFDWSFDEAIEKFDCQIHAFDPSIGVPDRMPKLHFHSIGIGAEDVERDPATGWKLMTLQSIHRMLQPLHGDVPIDYLKMDIEAAEWNVLPQIIRSGMLGKVKQFGLEIHFEDEMPTAELKKRLRVIKSLEESGMIRFASRPNIHTDGILENRDTFMCFELAWYNSKFTDKFH